MFNYMKSNFVLKLFVFCLMMPLSASCQTGAPPKSAENKNRPVNNSNKDNANQSKNDETETSLKPSSSGVSVTKDDVAQKGVRVEDFSPKNWHLMMKAEGDLNGDGAPDAVAAFSKAKLFDAADDSSHSSAQSEEDVNTERVFIIALRDANGVLQLEELSRKVILCRLCGAQTDETLLGLDIKNGAVEITQAALGTSSADYLHKIKKDAARGWIVFYGEGKFRQRSTGKNSAAKQRATIPLAGFDISKEVEKLGLSAKPTKKAKR